MSMGETPKDRRQMVDYSAWQIFLHRPEISPKEALDRAETWVQFMAEREAATKQMEE
jgi:hypothetical protein